MSGCFGKTPQSTGNPLDEIQILTPNSKCDTHIKLFSISAISRDIKNNGKSRHICCEYLTTFSLKRQLNGDKMVHDKMASCLHFKYGKKVINGILLVPQTQTDGINFILGVAVSSF